MRMLLKIFDLTCDPYVIESASLRQRKISQSIVFEVAFVVGEIGWRVQ